MSFRTTGDSAKDAKLQQQFFDYIRSSDYLKDHQGVAANAMVTVLIGSIRSTSSSARKIPEFFKGNKGVTKLDVYNFTIY